MIRIWIEVWGISSVGVVLQAGNAVEKGQEQ